MGTFTTLPLKHPRAPFTKPGPGVGINWAHPFAQGLVHSYPFNEGKGEQIKNYCWPAGEYDLKFRVPNVADSPRWGTFANVNGLEIDIDQGNPLDHARGNTGNTSPDTTGANLLPPIDFTKGFTIHLWMRPTESLVGVVTSYALFAIGDINASIRSTMVVHLTRFAASGTDWWAANVTLYSNGTANVTHSSANQVWEAPFTGGRVKIDSLPYEHVVCVMPGSVIKWFSSDGIEQNLFTLPGTITPPDNNQYWPLTSPSGMSPFEGHIWGWNVYNRVMHYGSAMELMQNPLGMYHVKSSGGLYQVIPPLVDPVPPPSGGGGTDEDDDALVSSQICVDII